LPSITFPTRATFYWNGQKVNAFHVENAHTDGDSVARVSFKARRSLSHTTRGISRDRNGTPRAASCVSSTQRQTGDGGVIIGTGARTAPSGAARVRYATQR